MHFISDQATGTAPFTVASTTVVANLNADLLDGNHASAFLTSVTAHNLLSATHTDSTTASVVRGDIIIGSVAAPNTKWTRLALGAAGTYLAGSATEPAWATLNQAAVSGLTTTDGPTFAHLHITDLAAITTVAESWVGPSATTGIYFKGGFVGLGTATPVSKLDIQDSTAFSTSGGFTHLRLTRTGVDGGTKGDYGAGIVFRQNYITNYELSVSTAGIRAYKDADSYAYGGGLQLLYQPNSAGEGLFAGLTLSGDGYVGIGTVAPLGTLHIKATQAIPVATIYLDAYANTAKSILKFIRGSIDGEEAKIVNDFHSVGTPADRTMDFYQNSINTMTLKDGKVGIGTDAPNANAILDVTSTTKAFMPPRMTTTQRDAIASPTEGMVIFNTTTHVLNFYYTSWAAV